MNSNLLIGADIPTPSLWVKFGLMGGHLLEDALGSHKFSSLIPHGCVVVVLDGPGSSEAFVTSCQ